MHNFYSSNVQNLSYHGFDADRLMIGMASGLQYQNSAPAILKGSLDDIWGISPNLEWSLEKCGWSRRFNEMHGTLHALHVSLNNAAMRTVCKWLKGDNGHLITLQVWTAWRYYVFGATHAAILKPPSKAQNSFSKKSYTREDMGQFFAGPINKAVPSFNNSLTRVRKGSQTALRAFFCT